MLGTSHKAGEPGAVPGSDLGMAQKQKAAAKPLGFEILPSFRDGEHTLALTGLEICAPGVSLGRQLPVNSCRTRVRS